MKIIRMIAAGMLGLATALGAFAQLETQTSASQGVSVKATPKTLAAGAPIWEFTVVLETHSGELTDDLAKTAVLVGFGGQRIAPVAWDGAPAGGHHRQGVLRFAPIDPMPSTVELQIQRPGESAPRVFRWELR
jgi:hypothetical protein